MKHAILAPLCSAFVLPGLGQVLNRQIIKGLILIALITALFMAILVKVLLDLSAVLSHVIGQNMVLGREQLPAIIAGMRARDMTFLGILIVLGVGLWAYGILDAYLVGRHYQPPPEKED